MIAPSRVVSKSRKRRPLATGKQGEKGRFVTLRSGQVIFIPEGKRTKWADVRDEIRGGREEEGKVSLSGWSKRDKQMLGGTAEDLRRVFAMPGMNTKMSVTSYGKGGSSIRAGFLDRETGEKMGKCEINLIYEYGGPGRIWEGKEMRLPPKVQDRGLGRAFLERIEGYARQRGFAKLQLEAGMTIGRYAWAKQGYRYKDPGRVAEAAANFRRWAKGKGIDLDKWPKFGSVRDVATYNVRGTVLLGRDIENKDVPSDMSLPLGKAFMLDMGEGGQGIGQE